MNVRKRRLFRSLVRSMPPVRITGGGARTVDGALPLGAGSAFFARFAGGSSSDESCVKSASGAGAGAGAGDASSGGAAAVGVSSWRSCARGASCASREPF